jgi:hypothetical protein
VNKMAFSGKLITRVARIGAVRVAPPVARYHEKVYNALLHIR